MFGIIYGPFELKINSNVGLSIRKTRPKHFPSKSKTALKLLRKRPYYWPPKVSKSPLKTAKISKFLTENFNFSGSFINLSSWKYPNGGLLRSKTLPKQFLNNSKISSKKSRKQLFWPTKWSKMTPQNRQNEQNFDRKFQFLVSFINLSSWKYTQK